MSLTRDEWGRIVFGGFGLAVFIAVLNIGVREWYQPDVRYVTGGAYVSSKCGAISSLALTNWGRAAAEEVSLSAVFTDPLTDISAGPMGTHVDVATGGMGHKLVTGTIKRLVPGESVYIYFFTQPSSPWSEPGQFIRGIKFNDGLGKTGIPVRQKLLMAGGFALIGVAYISLYYFGRTSRESFRNSLSEAVQMGQAAALDGLTWEQLRTRVEEYRKALPWFRRPSQDPLLRCAQAAFTGAKNILTSTRP